MKKFFVGVSALSLIVTGLAGCGNAVDRDTAREKFHARVVANAPDVIRENANFDKITDCIVEKSFDAFTDDQVAEIDRLIDASEKESQPTPEWFKQPFKDAETECKAKYMDDSNK